MPTTSLPHSAGCKHVFVVRLTAIGDTLIAIHAARRLFDAGFAPVLITSTANRAIAECVPFLDTFALFDDLSQRLTFFKRQIPPPLRAGTEAASGHPIWVEDDLFATTLSTQLNIKRDNNSNNKRIIQRNSNGSDRLPILDLQHTSRSRRCLRAIARECLGKNIEIRKVKKHTLFRVLLLILAFFSARQTPRHPKAWSFVRARARRVHELQAQLVDEFIGAQKLLPNAPMTEQRTGECARPQTSLDVAHVSLPEAIGARIAGGFKFVAFFPGASGQLKAWPKEHFRACIESLLATTLFDIVLCGAKDEEDVGRYLDYPKHDRVVNLIGKCTLAQTLGVIGSAAHIVTGDSFATHAADLLGIKTSVIFGATTPLLGFAPVSQKAVIHYADLSCSPCTRHGKGNCRFGNLRCLTQVRPASVIDDIRCANSYPLKALEGVE